MPFAPIPHVASQLGVPCVWLRRRAESGAFPVLRAGRQLLADPDEVAAALRLIAGASVVNEIPKLVALAALAEQSLLTRAQLIRLVNEGRLRAFKFGTSYLVEETYGLERAAELFSEIYSPSRKRASNV